MDYNLPVKTFWTDHTQNGFMGRMCTVNQTWYTVIINTVGVIFGLSQPRIERILSHLFAWIAYFFWPRLCSWFSRKSRSSGLRESGDPEERRRLNESALIPRGDSYSNRDEAGKQNPRLMTFAKVVSLLLVLLGTGYIIAGTLVTEPQDGEAALSAAKVCGAWGLSDDANPIAQDEDALIQGEMEKRASQYARNCYGSQSATSLTQCLVFRKDRIKSTLHTGRQCPFKNSTYCWGDGYTAVKFTTGLADSNIVGLNADPAPKINRTTVCVPLDVDAGFVEKLGYLGEWGYKLGPVHSDEYSSDYTFRQFGDPFTYDVRSYTMSTYTHIYSNSAIQNYWQPIDGLRIRPELTTKSAPYSLTIMFINSCRIFYKEASDDPIFPANGTYRDTGLWVNKDSRARPLACIDWIETCSIRGKCVPTYPVHSSENGKDDQSLDSDKFDIFTRFSLNKSTTFNAIEFRGATGLDAQYKIRDDTSLPLAKDQWIRESWALFNTSLARIQYDAYDIANGTGWDNKLYEPKMPPDARKAMCEILTFQIPKLYNNIRIWPRLLEVGLVLLVAWGLGYETKVDFNEEQKKSGRFEGMKLLGIEWLFRACFSREQKSENPPADASAADQGDMTAATSTSAQEPRQQTSPGGAYGTMRPAQEPDSSRVDVDDAFALESDEDSA